MKRDDAKREARKLGAALLEGYLFPEYETFQEHTQFLPSWSSWERCVKVLGKFVALQEAKRGFCKAQIEGVK